MKALKSIGAARVVHQEHLHLDDVGHAEAVPFQNSLDLVEHADGLGLGVAIGLRTRRVGILVDHGRHLAADIVSGGVAGDLHGLRDRERRIGNRMPDDFGLRGLKTRDRIAAPNSILANFMLFLPVWDDDI